VRGDEGDLAALVVGSGMGVLDPLADAGRCGQVAVEHLALLVGARRCLQLLELRDDLLVLGDGMGWNFYTTITLFSRRSLSARPPGGRHRLVRPPLHIALQVRAN
jgi:hypothetical protein